MADKKIERTLSSREILAEFIEKVGVWISQKQDALGGDLTGLIYLRERIIQQALKASDVHPVRPTATFRSEAETLPGHRRTRGA